MCSSIPKPKLPIIIIKFTDAPLVLLTVVGEVALAEFVLLDLEAALDELLSLVAAHGDVDCNLFVPLDGERAHGVAGLGLDGLLVGEVLEHLGRLGELIARLTSAEVEDELLDADFPHLVVELFLLLLNLLHIFFLNLLNLIIINAPGPVTQSIMAAFQPQDYSRFLIREFLKKSGFSKTYDQFMQEDTRPKVTMTKAELTKLLNLADLNRRNQKNKQFETMLDMCCNYFAATKAHSVPVDLPDKPALEHQKSNPVPAKPKQADPPIKMSKTSAGGFYKAPVANPKPESEDEAAYEWDESPSKKKAAAPLTQTTQNFYKPAQQKRNFMSAADDDLEDWDDGIELKKAAPKKTTAVWSEEPAKPDDTLGFLKRAEAEKAQIANRGQEESKAHYKSLAELKYKNPRGTVEPDSYSLSDAGGQSIAITGEQCQGVKQLLFASQTGSFHDSWCQGFYFDQKLQYGIY